MASLIKQYLCCCLAQSAPSQDHPYQDERAPLLNPDILPSAPSRPTARTTEQEQAERDQLRRILHLAEQRLLSVESLAPFRSLEPEPASAPPGTSRKSRRQKQQPPARSSVSSSSTLTSTSPPPRRRQPNNSQRRDHDHDQDRDRDDDHDVDDDDDDDVESGSPSQSRSRSRVHHHHHHHPAAGAAAAAGGGGGDEGAGPLAPIRVVHLDRTTWTETIIDSQPRSSRAGSSHSMKTLPRRRRGTSSSVAGCSGDGNGDGDREQGNDNDDDEFHDAETGRGGGGGTASSSTQSRFGTVESYRTAAEGPTWSGSGPEEAAASFVGGGGGRRHARDLWSQATSSLPAAGDELPTRQQQQQQHSQGTDKELARAIEQLERDIDEWTLPPHGPFTAELGGEAAAGARA